MPYGVDGQSEKRRFDLTRVYDAEIEHWLLPTNTDVTQTAFLAAFLVHPELDPDYSVCLIDSAQHSFLQLRLVDKNLNQELMTRFLKKQSLDLQLLVSTYSVSISQHFKKKLLSSFAAISHDKEMHYLEISDGITYEFIRIKEGKVEHLPFLFGNKGDSYESFLIKLCMQISNDLKSSSFKESKYFDILK